MTQTVPTQNQRKNQTTHGNNNDTIEKNKINKNQNRTTEISIMSHKEKTNAPTKWNNNHQKIMNKTIPT